MNYLLSLAPKIDDTYKRHRTMATQLALIGAIATILVGCHEGTMPQKFKIIVPDGFHGPIAILPGASSTKSNTQSRIIEVHIPPSGIVSSPYKEPFPEYFELEIRTESGKAIPTGSEGDAPESIAFRAGGLTTVNSSPVFYSGFIGTSSEENAFDRMEWMKAISNEFSK